MFHGGGLPFLLGHCLQDSLGLLVVVVCELKLLLFVQVPEGI